MGRLTRGLLGTALVILLLCGFIGFASASLLALTEVLAELGPASPSLSSIGRAYLTARLLAQASKVDSPAGAPDASLELAVPEGASAQSVIDQLQEAGIVNDGALLRYYMQYRGLDVGIQAGAYKLSGSMTVRQLADALQTAQQPEIVLTILEGWRLEQIAEAIDNSDLPFTGEEFLAEGPSDHELAGVTSEAGTLEGFLFPDTYHLEPNSSPEVFVQSALDNFQRRVGPELRAAFDAHGLTLREAVTLASIVEREAVVPAERPLIAAVFVRRLKNGLPLEADPTVQYAIGQQETGEWWKSPLSLLDLEVDSPFNTYRYSDLPPAPISAPGLASLQSVGSPAETSYLYFRAACDGSGQHQFAETFEQHLRNACP